MNVNFYDIAPADLIFDKILCDEDIGEEGRCHLMESIPGVQIKLQIAPLWHFSDVHCAVITAQSVKLYPTPFKDNTSSLDIHHRSPLYWAARRGDLTTVRTLLEQGADPNIG
ncbi:hypothetical protein B0H63DRAFT_252845 [Podospora didyma]|uniref:Ankyrin repeat protein n=1 Tax=Podospora didyma TaxID=330526 RepID=A0AAE0KDI8_9PEZI|nr:hypothetical protein B0H63DRAFT_252845 [Podospora didyma]